MAKFVEEHEAVVCQGFSQNGSLQESMVCTVYLAFIPPLYMQFKCGLLNISKTIFRHLY